MRVEPDHEDPIGGQRSQLRRGEIRLTRRIELRIESRVVGPRLQVSPRERDTQLVGANSMGEALREADVIIYGPLVHLELGAQISGIPATDGPMPFKANPEYPNLGKPAASDDITGGPGYGGIDNLRKFVEGGGVLLTLGKASSLPLEGGIVRGVRPDTKAKVFTPGSELRITFARPGDPLGYGFGKETSVFRGIMPVYDRPRSWLQMAYCTSCLDGPVIDEPVDATWGGTGDMVVSGGMRGEKDLAGKPAIFNFKVGHGRVIAYNFSPIHRDMNRSDPRLLWNAILNWNALAIPEQKTGTPAH